MTYTAGIIIIGDEILSGMVHDSNSPFMSRELRRIGIDVRRISVIGDKAGDIAKETKAVSERFDYVFTSGGIGPTHDDVTIEGISKAFGVRTVINDRLRSFLEKRFGENLSPAQLRMAEVPEGAEVIKDESIGLPLIKFKNIYILPGVPKYLMEKFDLITKLLFNMNPPSLKKVYVNEHETNLAPLLNEIVKSNKGVKVGSYPAVDRNDYSVMVTLESPEMDSLNTALQSLLNDLPPDKVVKVES